MPTTPFSGVRISWLMVARKAALARAAASASSRDAASSAVRRCTRASRVSLASRRAWASARTWARNACSCSALSCSTCDSCCTSRMRVPCSIDGHFAASELLGAQTEPAQLPADAVRHGVGERGAEQDQQRHGDQRGLQAAPDLGGEIAFRRRHHQRPAQAQGLAERALHHQQRIARQRQPLQRGVDRHRVLAAAGAQRLQGVEAGADDRVGAAARTGPLISAGRSGEQGIAGRTGHQQALFVDHEGRAVRADALGPQHVGQVLQVQVGAEDARGAAIGVVHRLRQADHQLPARVPTPAPARTPGPWPTAPRRTTRCCAARS